jgi:4'-phosphopantetheinyl transferase
MNIYWLAQREEDMPESNEWLGAWERNHLRSLTFLKRRTNWRLGRWTAKCALAALQNLPPDPDILASLEICAAPSGAPEAHIHGAPADVTISISHRDGLAICALAQNRVRLGCDLEVVEPRTSAFVSDYFTDEEQRFVERMPAIHRSHVITLLWSTKESVLKALREGLRRDTRSVSVSLPEVFLTDNWIPVEVRSVEGDFFQGWWFGTDHMIQTVVADHCFSPPVQLSLLPAMAVA